MKTLSVAAIAVAAVTVASAATLTSDDFDPSSAPPRDIANLLMGPPVTGIGLAMFPEDVPEGVPTAAEITTPEPPKGIGRDVTEATALPVPASLGFILAGIGGLALLARRR